MEYFQREDIRSVAHLELYARQVVEGFITGMHKSPYHGFSVEFAEHRQYNPGESTKNIDWKVYARSDKLFTKRYEEETNLRCQIIIDASSSMFYPSSTQLAPGGVNKYEFSCLAAAALMNLLKRQRDAYGLTLFHDEILDHLRPKNSTAHYTHIMERLYHHISQPPVQKTTNAIQTLHEVAERLHRRSMVILFSDMVDSQGQVDELFSALQHLKFNQHDVIVMHVQHQPTELDFAFENRPYEFVDLESGEQVKLQPSEVKEQYKRMKHDLHQRIEQTCLQFRMDYQVADITSGFVPVLRTLLAKRQRT